MTAHRQFMASGLNLRLEQECVCVCVGGGAGGGTQSNINTVMSWRWKQGRAGWLEGNKWFLSFKDSCDYENPSTSALLVILALFSLCVLQRSKKKRLLWDKDHWLSPETDKLMHFLVLSFFPHMKLHCFPSNSCLTLLPSVLLFQWKAARTGRWTTWNTRCFWGSLYGLSVLCSMDIFGPTTRTRRVPDSASCGTKVRDMGTLRSPLASTARGWARRRTPYGFDQRSWTTWGTTPACWGKSCWKLLSSNVYCCFYWFSPLTAPRSWRIKKKPLPPLYICFASSLSLKIGGK